MRWVTAGSIALLISTHLGSAWADGVASVPGRALFGSWDGVAEQKARVHFVEGARHLQSGRAAEARAAFLAAWELHGHPQIAGKLGECEMVLGLYAEAAAHLAFALDDSELSAADREKVKQSLGEAASKVSRLEIHGDPPGAELWIRGEQFGNPGTSTRVVYVTPGATTVELRMTGLPTQTRVVDATPGVRFEIALDLDGPGSTKPIFGPRTSEAPRARPAAAAGGGIDGEAVAIVGLTTLGVGGLAVGVGFMAAALDTDSHVGSFTALAVTGYTANVASWIGAGFLVAGRLSKRPGAAAAAGVEVLPMAGPGTAGVVVRGGFL